MEANLAQRINMKQETWEGAMGSLYDYYISVKDLINAGKVMEGLVLEHRPNSHSMRRRRMCSGSSGIMKMLYFISGRLLP